MVDELKGCTFKPNTRESSPSKEQPDAPSVNKDQLFETLAQSQKNEKIKIYEQRKSQLELRGCTFRPNLIKNMHSQRNSSQQNLSIGGFAGPFKLRQTSASSQREKAAHFDRLYKTHKINKERLDKKRKEIERERMEAYTFKPKREAKQYEQKQKMFANID